MESNRRMPPESEQPGETWKEYITRVSEAYEPWILRLPPDDENEPEDVETDDDFEI